MRTAWTQRAEMASPLEGEAVASDTSGGSRVTINQFPDVMLNAAMQPAATMRKAAYIVAWRNCFAPT
ncbi:hypothetical protein XH90_00835 [Bradyrhizobium sp. CCBAU 53338]|nr:hypothetical protein XH90_00835 [Bradyrhizobium sp. CCBAU 53338]